MARMVAVGAALLLVLVVAPACGATDHTVGGSSGWDSTVDYGSWASGETFKAGDTLTFKYSGGLHSVYQVSKSDYDSCSTGNAIASDSTGSTTVKLDKAGTKYYFVCGTMSHCLGGMKLAATTAGSGGGGSGGGGSSSSTPSSPTGTDGYSSSSAPFTAGSTAFFTASAFGLVALVVALLG